MEHLFVYGTLAPGKSNHHIMTPILGTWQQAAVKGVMDEIGFGLTGGYPALVIDDTAALVQGWLLSSDELDVHWERLDAFEGTAYQRERIMTTIQTGECVSAYVYALHRKLYHLLDVSFKENWGNQ
ncbi:gamma-glutamylcyclotransferase family protein [Moraxella canis]|uniref:gamma-glutamylcyclotransferase family protein n=1 Tax=Moraxella canis TaxID=90239 RepID=UPI000665BF6F|nr:gamma-glutamylcyclotransferase [Moraxella canis]